MFEKWMEKNLEDPFFQAEMVKAEINVAEGADRNLGTVKVMACYGTLLMCSCAYWYGKYIAG